MQQREIRKYRGALKVGIIIVGYRNPADVTRCLNALARSTYDNFSVQICENGGDRAFVALQAAVPPMLAGGQHVDVHDCGQNLGFAGGVNRGFELTSQSDAWWILNPDTVPSPDALECLVERYLQGGVSAVGGVLISPNGTVQALGGLWRDWLARPVSIGKGLRPEDADQLEVERRQNYILGASMLVGRPFVETVGLMREDYFLYAEEIEWFLRARAAGLRLGFSPAARVLHVQGTTTGSGGSWNARSPLSVFLDERNKLLVVRDTYPWRLIPASLAAMVLLLLRYGRAGAWGQLLTGLRGWWAGFLGHRGKPKWLRT